MPVVLGRWADCDLGSTVVRRHEGRAYLSLPGAIRTRQGIVRATHDAAQIVAEELGLPAPALPAGKIRVRDLPGIGEYRRRNLTGKLWQHQKSAAKWMLARGWGINGDPCRTGKSRSFLAAALLGGANRITVLCLSIGKLGWAREASEVFGERALLVYGRAGDKARWAGDRQYLRGDDARQAALTARVVIVNYDILIAQQGTDGSGREFVRRNLPGWAPILAERQSDWIALDESHQRLRGHKLDQGIKIRAAATQITEPAERCYALTATPFTYVRDLHSQLNLISGGLFGSKPFGWQSRYCGGIHETNDAGFRYWRNDGISRESELSERMGWWLLRRRRAEIGQDMPREVRQLIDLERPKNWQPKMPRGSAASKLERLMGAALEIKIPALIENVMSYVVSGEKAVAYCKSKASCRKIYNALIKAAEGKRSPYSESARRASVKIWGVSTKAQTETGEQRSRMADDFMAHSGGGIWVATIDSMPGSISLAGATSVHFAEVHHDPNAMHQAERRPFVPGVRGIAILYYRVVGSYDQRLFDLVIPRVENLCRLLDDDDSQNVLETLQTGETPSAEKMLDELTAGLNLESVLSEDYGIGD